MTAAQPAILTGKYLGKFKATADFIYAGEMEAGEWGWIVLSELTRIFAFIPPGGEIHAFLAVSRDKGAGVPGMEWQWDGNVEKPTLSPAIVLDHPKGWNGWVRKGNFERA